MKSARSLQSCPTGWQSRNQNSACYRCTLSSQALIAAPVGNRRAGFQPAPQKIVAGGEEIKML
jgi:hypothetical protein